MKLDGMAAKDRDRAVIAFVQGHFPDPLPDAWKDLPQMRVGLENNRRLQSFAMGTKTLERTFEFDSSELSDASVVVLANLPDGEATLFAWTRAKTRALYHFTIDHKSVKAASNVRN